jgi:hypothetical protein
MQVVREQQGIAWRGSGGTVRRLVRVLAALAIGAACCVVVFAGSVASATVVAWGSHGDGDAHPEHSPAPYCPPTTRPTTTTRPYVRPPYTRPPVTHPPVTKPPVTQPPASKPPVSKPPVTKPPVTKPPVTEPGSNEQSSGPPVTLPPPTVPIAVPTVGTPTPAVVAADVAPLDTFDTFQAFVKGIEANAARERARRAASVPRAVAAIPAPTPIISHVTPPPALLPPGPFFHDSPAPLLPLNASGLRTARSFVFLFGLSALALGFLAVRARLARRNHDFVSAAIDEHGDYVEFV